MNAEVRNEYAARAAAVQNHPANWNVDITTFVHLAATEGQVKRHVEYYEARARAQDGAAARAHGEAQADALEAR